MVGFEEKQISLIPNLCHNFQDAVIVRGLWEGITPNEFINLKRGDVDFDDFTINLNDNHNDRILIASQELINLIEGALRQESYAKRNGIHNFNSREYIELVMNDYVLRGDSGVIQVSDIHDRINELADALDLPILTVDNLVQGK